MLCPASNWYAHYLITVNDDLMYAREEIYVESDRSYLLFTYLLTRSPDVSHAISVDFKSPFIIIAPTNTKSTSVVKSIINSV